MKDTIPPFLKSTFKKAFPKYKDFSKEINQFIIDYAAYYEWETTDIRLIYKMIKKGFSERPQCAYKDCNCPSMIITSNVTFSKGCCIDHARKISFIEKYGVEHNWQKGELRTKQEETMFKKYGVTHNWQKGKLRENQKKTMVERYGVEHNWQKGVLREKQEKTMVERYGVKHNLQSDELRDTYKETMIEKYGVDNPQKNKDIKQKTKNTLLRKYGVENISQIDSVKEKKIKTSLMHFGVENPMQNGVIADKSNGFKNSTKQFEWQTGESVTVQGNEPIVLKELEKKGYTFKDVLTKRKDMPQIWYVFNGKKKRYYPDIFIPSENLIIEVKSEYTLNADRKKNELKFEAVKKMGFDFRLEIR